MKDTVAVHIPQAAVVPIDKNVREEAVVRTDCMGQVNKVARIDRFVREAEPVGAGSMDRLEEPVEACTVDLEARLGRTILVAPKQ